MRDWHAPILEARAHGGEISAGQQGPVKRPSRWALEFFPTEKPSC